MAKVDYKSAGVDISAGNLAVKKIKSLVESTFSKAVLTPIGAFGAMYDLSDLLKHYKHPVLVQSIDGVGTKMMIAKRMNRYDTIGIDLVSATANDIIVLGAKPLTLLDYIANDALNPDIIAQILAGMVSACRENNIALVGGETAEMPGTYLPGEHDLVGIVTGILEKDQAILGKAIAPGDVVLGLTSNGLHTNGYSLARKLLFDVAGYDVQKELPIFPHVLGAELLRTHTNYTQAILNLLAAGIPIKGMAHITGGGLLENIPRILPPHCDVMIDKSAWPEQAIFTLLKNIGELDDAEMYRTFNMGIGLIMIVNPAEIAAITKMLTKFAAFSLHEIGNVVSGSQQVRLI